MQHGRFRIGFWSGPVMHRYGHQYILWSGFGVFNKHVEIPIRIEKARVKQFKFGVQPSPVPVFGQQLLIRIRCLRVLVQHPLVGVRRCRVKIIVQFLNILAVVPLAVGQAKIPLFQNRVLPIPECQSQTQLLFVVAETRNGLLTPPIGVAAGHVVGRKIPGVAVGAVIFADGAPLPVGDVRSPLPPRGVFKALLFGGHRLLM